MANKGAQFSPAWVDNLYKKAQEYADHTDIEALQGVTEPQASLPSKDIYKAFNFGLQSREKQNKSFRVPQTMKLKIASFSKNSDAPFLSDEMNQILKRLHEERKKRHDWLQNKLIK